MSRSLPSMTPGQKSHLEKIRTKSLEKNDKIFDGIAWLIFSLGILYIIVNLALIVAIIWLITELANTL